MIKNILTGLGFHLIRLAARPGKVTGIKVVIFVKSAGDKKGQYFERWLLPDNSGRVPEQKKPAGFMGKK